MQTSKVSAAHVEATIMPAPLVCATNPDIDKLDCLGRQAPPWNALESDPNATLVKTGRRRKVWRVTMPRGQCVYAKVFDDPVGSATHWLKRTLRIHPAIREWRALMRLQTLRVPAVRPVALVKYAPSPNLALSQRSGATAYRFVLLTAGMEHAATLISAWRAIHQGEANRPAETRSLSAAVAGLWAHAHNRGYAHPDGHPGNVLIVNDDSSEFGAAQAIFIDPALARLARPGRPVSTNRALLSLAMLDQYFHRCATRAQRLRFWREYWLRREILLDRRAERRRLRRLAEHAATHRVGLARQRDRRLRGDGKYFGRLRLSGGWQAKTVLQLERRHVFLEAEIPKRSFDEWASLCTRILRASHDQSLASNGIRLVRRPSNHRGPWAESLFAHCHRLRHRDIAAPLVLGYLQNRTFLTIQDEYLIFPAEQLEQPP